MARTYHLDFVNGKEVCVSFSGEGRVRLGGGEAELCISAVAEAVTVFHASINGEVVFLEEKGFPLGTKQILRIPLGAGEG